MIPGHLAGRNTRHGANEVWSRAIDRGTGILAHPFGEAVPSSGHLAESTSQSGYRTVGWDSPYTPSSRCGVLTNAKSADTPRTQRYFLAVMGILVHEERVSGLQLDFNRGDPTPSDRDAPGKASQDDGRVGDS